MKTKPLILVLVTVALFTTGGIIAKAEGSWRYGYTFATAYSNYYHPKKQHSATVINKNTKRRGYDESGPGAWAKALVGRSVNEKASFYYNFW